MQKVFEEGDDAATVDDVGPEMAAVWRSGGGIAAFSTFSSLFRRRAQLGEDKE